MANFSNYMIWIVILFINWQAAVTDICKFRPYGTRVSYPDGNCSLFAFCAFQKISYVSECPRGLHFNSRISECDLPSRAGCEKAGECAHNYCELCDCEICCGDGTTTPTTTSTTTPTTTSTTTPTSTSTTAPTTTSTTTTTTTTPSPGRCDGDTSGVCEDKDDGTPLQIEGECKKFIVCETECPTTVECDGKLYFNPETGKCDLPGVCIGETNGTLLPQEGDCTKFISCSNGCVIQKECVGGLYFNPQTKTCEPSANVECLWPPPETGPSAHVCSVSDKCLGQNDGAKFSHPRSCDKYIVCECECDLEMPCAPGTEYNEENGLCDWPNGCTNKD